MSALRRLVGRPWLHFLLIGAALYFLERGLLEEPPSSKAFRVSLGAEDVASIAYAWWRSAGRSPSEQELGLLVEQRVDDELLLQAARAQGWSRSDSVVRQRLIRNQRFLSPDTGAEDAELLEIAYEQGMHRGDIVVRRRLIERMRLAIAATARAQEPDDAALQGYLGEHRSEFRRPARVRLTQIYLSSDQRGETLGADAEALLTRLRAEAWTPEAAIALGDPILLPHHVSLWPETTLASRFGPDFAKQAIAAELGRWSGPIPSSYGLHLIWAHEHEPSRDPDLAEIRREVRAAYFVKAEQRAIRRALLRLREDAEISVVMPSEPLVDPGTG